MLFSQETAPVSGLCCLSCRQWRFGWVSVDTFSGQSYLRSTDISSNFLLRHQPSLSPHPCWGSSLFLGRQDSAFIFTISFRFFFFFLSFSRFVPIPQPGPLPSQLLNHAVFLSREAYVQVREGPQGTFQLTSQEFPLPPLCQIVLQCLLKYP